MAEFTTRKAQLLKDIEEAKLHLAQLEEELTQLENQPLNKKSKLSDAQQKAFDRIINAPFVEDIKYMKVYDNCEYKSLDFIGKQKNGLIGVRESSSTLKALEKKGYIKIHELGGEFSDTVELLIGKNTSVSIFENKDLQEVKVFLDGGVNAEKQYNDGSGWKEFIERGDIKSVLSYWENRLNNVTKIVDAKSGEVLYKV